MIDGMRHAELYDPAKYKDKLVTLVGVGTIGSHTANILARMQVPMNLYDHDSVEEHNLATQSYGITDIGKNKVDAVVEQLKAIDPDTVAIANVEMFPSEIIAGNIIVSCVDSLDARKNIARVLIERGITIPIIDGRVGAQQLEVYYFENATAWQAQLPEVADEDPCGARFTAYTAYICAGLIANFVKKVLLQEKMHTTRVIFDAQSMSYITTTNYD